MNIYELTGNHLILQQIASEAVSDEERQLITESLADSDEAIADKAEAYAMIIKNLSALADGRKQAAREMVESAKAIEHNITTIKTRLLDSMIALGKKKIQTTMFNIGTRASKAVVIDDESAVPDDYITVETVRKINKREIMAECKKGQDVPGCHLEERSSITIK